MNDYLYHGTSSIHLDSILRDGLKPRGRKKGNWESYPSRSDMVYLSSAYAPYFAINSCKKGEKALILEINTSKLEVSNLYPDEDFIVQAIAMNEKQDLDDIHNDIRDTIENYQHHYLDSLGGLGNVSHMGKVPSGAISRYILLDYDKRSDLGMMVLDPCISLLNFKFCGNRYRSIISWLFNDRKDFEIGIGDNETYIELLERNQPGYRKILTTLFANREGIEIFSCSEARAA